NAAPVTQIHTVSVAAMHSRSPIWVINVILSGLRPCPLFIQSLPNRCIATSDVQGHNRTHALQHDRDKKKDRQLRRSLRNPIRCFAQAASAAAFRYLRQPSRPIAPRPVAKSGSAAGSGVCDHDDVSPKSPLQAPLPAHQKPLVSESKINRSLVDNATLADAGRSSGKVPVMELISPAPDPIPLNKMSSRFDW